MSTHRKYSIFTADGQRHLISAASLRRALKQCGIDETKTPIVAAIESGCLPVTPEEERPFIAVLLKNPLFTPPPLE